MNEREKILCTAQLGNNKKQERLKKEVHDDRNISVVKKNKFITTCQLKNTLQQAANQWLHRLLLIITLSENI